MYNDVGMARGRFALAFTLLVGLASQASRCGSMPTQTEHTDTVQQPGADTCTGWIVKYILSQDSQMMHEGGKEHFVIQPGSQTPSVTIPEEMSARGGPETRSEIEEIHLSDAGIRCSGEVFLEQPGNPAVVAEDVGSQEVAGGWSAKYYFALDLGKKGESWLAREVTLILLEEADAEGQVSFTRDLGDCYEEGEDCKKGEGNFTGQGSEVLIESSAYLTEHRAPPLKGWWMIMLKGYLEEGELYEDYFDLVTGYDEILVLNENGQLRYYELMLEGQFPSPDVDDLEYSDMGYINVDVVDLGPERSGVHIEWNNIDRKIVKGKGKECALTVSVQDDNQQVGTACDLYIAPIRNLTECTGFNVSFHREQGIRGCGRTGPVQ